jgi:hypothetical protein
MKSTKGKFSFLAPEDDPHAFVTKKDLAEAIRLEARYYELKSYAHSITPAALIERVRQTREDFFRAPSQKTFLAVKEARLEESLFRGDTTIRSIANAGIKHFFSTEMRAWAQPIFQRALEIAQKRLDQIRKEEGERILELTGSPMTKSDVVDRALAPLRELQAHLRTLDNHEQHLGIDNMYRPRRVLPLFGFIDALPEEKPGILDAVQTRSANLECVFKEPPCGDVKKSRNGNGSTVAQTAAREKSSSRDVAPSAPSGKDQVNFDAALHPDLQKKSV